ncbi:MAG: hypothetical protein AAF198_06090 [Pseudomonadota bacterium]
MLLLTACETVPLVDPEIQTQTIADVNRLYEQACVQNVGKLVNAAQVFNTSGFDNVERSGSATFYFNDDDSLVAALVPFSVTESVGGERQAKTSGVQCSVGSPIYRVDAGRTLLRSMIEKYIPEGFYQRVPNPQGRDLIAFAINPDLYGKEMTWDTFIEVIVADDANRMEILKDNPDAPIFAFIAGVSITEITRTEE